MPENRQYYCQHVTRQYMTRIIVNPPDIDNIIERERPAKGSLLIYSDFLILGSCIYLSLVIKKWKKHGTVVDRSLDLPHARIIAFEL